MRTHAETPHSATRRALTTVGAYVLAFALVFGVLACWWDIVDSLLILAGWAA